MAIKQYPRAYNIPLPGDWHSNGIPSNILMHTSVYVDTSYSFTAFNSLMQPAMQVGKGSGIYDKASIVTGENGVITVGDFTMINGSSIICMDRISIGNYCMLSWGVVVTDCWNPVENDIADRRRRSLIESYLDPMGTPPCLGTPSPVLLEDNVWVGFDSVIMPGVTLGRGCIVGSKSVVERDIPPYAIVAGNPCKILRYLEPTDTDVVRKKIMDETGI